ncbi:thiol peroxidase [Granulicatella sp. zg-ZJ]|uniref:thiol peroxidase n=1 Tax=Granulicatella sp. zg-ZJ TaxID=2678504 RepID=UPI0013CF7F2C|nr:thiol peroxidase [Granulicatella sp. zg-ZJ]NEW62930.1 thiol peroxidase [Granulicatella sp. zg-ZJ]
MYVTRLLKKYLLLGEQPILHEMAPNFNGVTSKGDAISLEQLKGKVTIISVIPNINTPVCDMQTRAFNKQVSELNDVTLVTVAKNTPEEFNNWCASKGVDMIMLPDIEKNFGMAYGIVMDELDVLARSVFVIDKEGILAYMEIVPKMTQEPDYEKALEVAKELVG